MTSADDRCPCGLPAAYDECCCRFHAGADAPTAELLMRSRYSAYVVGNIDYVVATHDPAQRDQVDREAATMWSQQSQWLGLEIVATEAGGPDDDAGVVEFIARFMLGGRPQQHHERSRFTRVDEGAGPRWVYVDGEVQKARPVAREAPKVGRNEPCPCGSGKKFKKCHGA